MLSLDLEDMKKKIKFSLFSGLWRIFLNYYTISSDINKHNNDLSMT